MKQTHLLRKTVVVLGIAGFLMAFVLVSGIGCTRVGGGGSGSSGNNSKKPVDPWLTFKSELTRQPDVVTARRVLNQLNGDLNNANMSLPEFPAGAMAKAADKLSPSPDEARDWASPLTTAMDANYLGEALFFRSAARSLDVDGLPVEQQAKISFDWVCRQVYDRPWVFTERNGQKILLPAVPSQEVLNRGYGVGFDRENVFLALARQLGLDAVLIGPPGGERKERIATGSKNDNRGLFWAVGVRVGDDVILFDPWVGAAIPSVDGKGIITLTAAKANPKHVLDWLTSKKTTQPITAETIVSSICYVTAPMNGIPPRMKLLEDQLAAELGVKLAVNPDDVDKRLAKLPGGPPHWYGPTWAVDPFAPPHVLGRFLPATEGGYEKSPEGPDQLAFVLRNLEPLIGQQFENPLELKNGNLQRDFRLRCMSQFKSLIVDGDVDEKVFRGEFNEAIRRLNELDRMFATQRDRDRDPQVRKAVSDWYAAANEAYNRKTLASLPENASQLPGAEADVEALWRNNPASMAALQSVAAQAGAAEVAYLLALTKHEQAERTQLRYFRSTAEAKEAMRAKAAGDWAVAKDEWTRYLDSAARPGTIFPGRVEHAKKLAARAAGLMVNPDSQ